MKRITIFTAAVMLMVFSTLAFGQSSTDNSEKVLVDRSVLTKEQLAQVAVSNTATQVEQLGKYAGLGKEVAEAVNGSLSGLTDNANKFASTPVGHFAMWLVAYKVVGNKAVRLLIGTLLMIVMVPTLIRVFWRNAMVRGVVKRETYDEATRKRIKEYETYEPDSNRQWAYGAMSLIIILLLFLITAL